MKECELCNLQATMYCESDQARLCWNCDSKVHCANFLVARHSRSLLCHVCQSPTPWKASGSKLGHTVSICESCVSRCSGREDEFVREEIDDDDDVDQDDEINREDDVNEEEEEDEEDERQSDTDDGDEEEDGDNQVVPWSYTPPSPITSASSSEDSSRRSFNGERRLSESATATPLKRMREDSLLCTEENLDCSSSQPDKNSARIVMVTASQPSEHHGSAVATRSGEVQADATGQAECKTAALLSSVKRFQQDMISGNDASASILSICKLSNDPTAVDLLPNAFSGPPL